MRNLHSRLARFAVTALVNGVAVIGFTTAPASAQVGTARPERPNRAIFNGGYGEAEQSLSVSGQAGGGFASSGQVGTSGAEGDQPERSRTTFGHLSGAMAYLFDRDRFGASAGVTSAARFTPGESGITALGTSGLAGLRWSVTGRTELNFDARVAYEPLSLLNLLPSLENTGGPSLTALDYGLGLGTDNLLRYQASVGLSQALSSRADFDISYYRSYAQYTADDANQGYGTLAGLRYRIGRGLSVRVGYGRDEVSSAAMSDVGEAPRSSDRVDAGVDFQRALSISRRTTLAFRTGSVILSDSRGRYYDFVGGATLRRELGRTWFSSVAYNRDVALVSVFNRPSFTESLTAAVSGLFGRRVSFSSQAGVSRGKLGVVETNGYTVYGAGTGMSIGLTRGLGLGVQYSYFRYRFDQPGTLPVALPERVRDGHSVRVGLDLFAPIYHRARRR